MSWDATLYTSESERRRAAEGLPNALVVLDVNYTHNCSRMIYRVLPFVRPDRAPDRPWYALLDGMTGDDGAEYLDGIVGGLIEAPDLFRSMNPSNGWGDYDSLVALLARMRDASRAVPTGSWEASG